MKAHRVHVGETSGAVYAGLHRMSERAESAALAAGLTTGQIELIKLRCSQINGCAYCLDQHVRVATEAGESPARLAVLSAWRETEWFSADEQAMLELAESVTEMPAGPLEDDDYRRVLDVLGEEKYAAAFWVATVINSYNRVAITSHYHVGPEPA